MIEFIRHGLAIGMLMSFVEDIDDITTVPIRHHVPHFEVAIATPANRRLSASADALLQTIARRTAH